MGRYIHIDVVDTAVVCGLDIKPGTLDHEEVLARCPYCNDYKYRMYLSRQPGNATFWCHNCGTGGNAVTLYADHNPSGQKLTGAEAYRELIANPYVRCEEQTVDNTSRPTKGLRPIDERSQVYLDLLRLLPLSDRHYINLRNRGMSDTIINGNMYRSVPTDFKTRMDIIRDLSRKHDLSGIPGFYTKDGNWLLSNCHNSGILIPVCDRFDRIQGLQIRFDDPPPKFVTDQNGNRVKKAGDRFRWLSSGGDYYENGTGISSYIHVVGDTSSDTLHITEGAMKADVASYLSGGALFIGLTGVQNVRYLAEVIRDLSPQHIRECIDMDCRTNPHVQRAQSKIRAICAPLCHDYRPFIWPIEQKGIDDYCATCSTTI